MALLYRLGFLFALIVAITTSLLPDTSLAQSAQSDWIKPEPPTISTLSSNLPQSLLPASRDGECLPETKFITRPKNTLKGFTESSHQSCATQTAFGFHSSYNGYIRLNDSSLAGNVRSASNGALSINAIPQSGNLIYIGSGLYGSSRHLVKDFVANSYTVIQSDGSIQHRLKPGVTGLPIKDSQGSTLELRSFTFSNNGKWAISDVPFRGMTRINTETGETLIFGRGYDYSVGLNPSFVSAISGDGRYALVAESKYNTLKIFDLENCQPTTDPVKKSCAEKDLLPLIKSRVADYSELWSARFSTNYSIRIYVRKKDQNNQYSYDYQLWTAAGHQESGMEYLALGDSFASGEGAYSYKNGTDTEEPFNKCHLSTLSYPYLLASRAGLNSTESVACSGAKMQDIFSADQTSYNQHLKQSEGKETSDFNDQIYNNFLVGYRTQDSFVAKHKPRIATMSISGNDIGFGKILLACLMPGTCYQSEQEKLNLAYTINSKFDDLVGTYQQIKNSAASQAKIYVMGYPSLADPDGNCALNVHLNRDEIIFSNQIVNHLNNVVKRAAAKAGVVYIDVESAFDGSRLCEAPSSEVAVNGLTAGDDKTFSVPLKLINKSLDVYLTGRESYHPNQLGHRLYADTIFQATNGFTSENPDPQTSTQPPTLNNSSNLSPRRIVFDDNLSNDFLISNENIPLSANGLKPNTPATISLTSQAVNLGTIQTTQNGTISSTLTLPEEIEPGIHTLHLHTQNSSGEDLDIQKLIYVAASPTDINGNGIPNTQEACLLAPVSGVDEDKDGADDACDNHIGQPASPAQLSTSTSDKDKPQNNLPSAKIPPMYSARPDGPKQKITLSTRENIMHEVLGATNMPLSLQSNIQSAGKMLQPKQKNLKALAGILPVLMIAGALYWRRQGKR